jgi:hypothetical protein
MTEWAPVAIGGVGGSGTRVIAAILREAGVAIGRDLNDSLDNLWFTLLFKHQNILQAPDARFSHLVTIFVAGMSGGRVGPGDLNALDELAADDRIQHDSGWLRARAESLRLALARPIHSEMWGWKEPNTHVIIDRLIVKMPTLRYIHVVRNGLDMSFSANQNQLQFWGPFVLGADHAVTPRNSLRFWRWANSRILTMLERLRHRVMLIKFEDLCANPKTEVERLLSFTGIKLEPNFLDRATQLVVSPQSTGRYRNHSLDIFEPKDVAFVRAMGFVV